MITAQDVYDYIPVEKEALPERFDIELGIQLFNLQFNYNETGDFFTVDLYTKGDEGEDVPLILGEKLVLGLPLWGSIRRDDIPAPTLIPMDVGNQATRITYENFMESVFLYIADGGGPDDDTTV